jgi:hypothetical protein
MPATLIDRLGITIGDRVLPMYTEVGLVLIFGVIMLAIAIGALRRPD